MTPERVANEIARTLNDISQLQVSLSRLHACVDNPAIANQLSSFCDDTERVAAALLQYGAGVARQDTDGSFLKSTYFDEGWTEDVLESDLHKNAR